MVAILHLSTSRKFVSLVNSYELKVKGMVTGAFTDLHDKLDKTTKSVKFDLNEVCNVTRERHEIIVKNLYEFINFVEL